MNFPNPSRSYDESKKRICFWGYDKTLEISFYVELEALERLCPDMEFVETGFLKAFDTVRTRIYEVADKVYKQGKNGLFAYILAAKDFK